jgi:hypothetical protein
MIYIKKHNVEEKDFVALLKTTKQKLLNNLRKNKKEISFSSFETLVFECMEKQATGTGFEGTIKQTSTYAFPDIIANKFFGVEVKHTIKDHWNSTGNSILESNRIKEVERIYMLFGKFGGTIDIRYRLYQDCLAEVSVTHSPRYRINMDLADKKSIFHKIGIDYDTLRQQKNSINTIKNYYRKQLKDGEELWWIDQDSDDRAVSPIIKPFRNLSKKEKNNFISECFILFPEMFGNSMTKFERAAAYLIAEYNSISANLRDTFTAGGQIELKIKGKKTILPQIYSNLETNAKNIGKRIEQLDNKTLEYYWRVKKIESNKLQQWKKLLDKHAKLAPKSSKPSDVFTVGYGKKRLNKL